jgi:hypothetical protein
MQFLWYFGSRLEALGVFENIDNIVHSSDTDNLVVNLQSFVVNIVDILNFEYIDFFGSLFFALLVMLTVSRLFFGLYQIPLATSIYNKMHMDADIEFLTIFASSVVRSVKYTINRLVFALFFDLCMVALLVIGLFVLRELDAVEYALFVLGLIFLILLALRQTLVSCWVGSVVSAQLQPNEAFVYGVRKVSRRFWTVYLWHFVVSIVLITLNVSLAIPTHNFGLIITLPITVLFYTILDITVYTILDNKDYYINGKLYKSESH